MENAMKSIISILAKMKFIPALIIITVAVTIISAYPAGKLNLRKLAELKNGSYVKNELIVQYKKNISYAARRASVQGKGAKFLKEFGTPGLVHISLPREEGVEDALARYGRDPDIEFAQPNYIYRASAVPADPDYHEQWGLANTGQSVTGATYATNNPGTAGKDMSMEKTWDLITDCGSVIVAVVDSGVNYNHQDLSANMWDGGATYPKHGYDFVDSDNDPMDLNGHGTHVAATIGAKADSAGTVGICWSSKIMAVRSMNTFGIGSSAQIVSGINFAVTNGAKVINLSLTMSSSDPSLSNAITNARTSGVVVVTAAGNDGLNLNTTGNDAYPCEYTQDNILCVAALDQAYHRTSFSNYGSTGVDVGAPGSNILSAYHGTETEIADDFSGDWTKFPASGGWGEGDCNSKDMLMDPSNWCTTGSLYSSNAMDWAYKDFNLVGYEGAVLVFYANLTVLYGDSFSIYLKPGGGNPFTSIHLDQFSSLSTQGISVPFAYDITAGANQNTSIGFDLFTNATGNGHGVGISDFSIFGIHLTADQYKVMDGTSMAAPHAAGLATLLKAYNPEYTYADIIRSIKEGGDTEPDLAGSTTTGKAINSWGSLCYIQNPAGITAVVSGQ